MEEEREYVHGVREPSVRSDQRSGVKRVRSKGWTYTDGGRDEEREGERMGERQRMGERDREWERETEGGVGGKIERWRKTERGRERDRDGGREREREIKRGI